MFFCQEQKKIEIYVLNSGKDKFFGIVLCLYTGLHIGELLALTWDDIDFGKGLLFVSKTCHDGNDGINHIRITRVMECGLDVKTLSELLGHKNATITLNRFAHSLLEHKVYMMNRLGKLL